MMEYSGIISWLITLTYLSRSGCHVLDHIDNGSVCPPRTKYNMELLSSLVGVEKAIRDAVHSVTEQIITCPDDCDHTADQETFICPEGFFKRGRSCYIFSKITATWGNAMESCIKNFGGHLAVIEDEDENNYLKQLARSETPKDRLWIGGADAFKEGEWKWISTMEIISSSKFTNWYSGEPDNSSGTEDCLELHPGLDFSWNDDQCYNRHKFICEKVMD